MKKKKEEELTDEEFIKLLESMNKDELSDLFGKAMDDVDKELGIDWSE